MHKAFYRKILFAKAGKVSFGLVLSSIALKYVSKQNEAINMFFDFRIESF